MPHIEPQWSTDSRNLDEYLGIPDLIAEMPAISEVHTVGRTADAIYPNKADPTGSVSLRFSQIAVGHSDGNCHLSE